MVPRVPIYLHLACSPEIRLSFGMSTSPIVWRPITDHLSMPGQIFFLTNTFGGNSFRLKLHDAQDRVAEFNHAVAQIDCRQRS